MSSYLAFRAQAAASQNERRVELPTAMRLQSQNQLIDRASAKAGVTEETKGRPLVIQRVLGHPNVLRKNESKDTEEEQDEKELKKKTPLQVVAQDPAREAASLEVVAHRHLVSQ